MNNSIHIDRICNISRVSLWFESSLSSPLKLSNLHQQYCYYLIYLSKANMQTKPSLVKYWTKLACKGNEYISTHTHPPTYNIWYKLTFISKALMSHNFQGSSSVSLERWFDQSIEMRKRSRHNYSFFNVSEYVFLQLGFHLHGVLARIYNID